MFTWHLPVQKTPPPHSKLIEIVGEREVIDEEGRIYRWQLWAKNHIHYMYIATALITGERISAKESRFNQWEKNLKSNYEKFLQDLTDDLTALN